MYVKIIIAITILPQNPQIGWGSGWKTEENCPGSGEEYINCMEKIAYSRNDIFTNVTDILDDSFNITITTIYAGWLAGLVQSLDIPIEYITNSFMSTMELSLNSNLSYQILFMDPKIQIFSEIPNLYPITRISMSKEYDGALQVYLKVHFN